MPIFDIRNCLTIFCSTLLLANSLQVIAGPQGAARSSLVHQLHNELQLYPERGPELVTLIISDTANIGIAKAIKASGIKIEHQKKQKYQVRLPRNQIKQFLDKLPQGTLARLPYPHSSNTITSQGVSVTGATDMQNLAFDGSGVKIGVIDLGFASLATSQTANELPATGSRLTIVDYTGTSTGGTNHGTNVAEIVHDMAPGADLYLAKINTTLEMETAVDDMIAAGVQVINHSVGWYGAAFYDGTGILCDITNTASTSGMVWANSAGNARNQHYLGPFSDADNNLQHEFTTAQNYNTLSVTSGKNYTLVLNWDAYPSTSIDYDLFLYNADPAQDGTIVASSTNAQSGKGPSWFPIPYETITYTASTTTTLFIVVTKKDSGTTHLPLTLFTLNGSFGTKTLSSSITQPSDCASVLTVGAARVDNDNPEGFSSEGPTVDGRNKPDITGPDRVATSLSSSFAGTSAASPHAAGAAAQLMQQNPGMLNTNISNLLINTSHDISSVGFDFRTGSGRISMDADDDTVNHDDDNCPLTFNITQTDTDLDTAGNACDNDDDNDGLLDTFEVTIGSNPLLIDTDGDTISDYDEVAYDGDPNNYSPETDLNPVSSDTDNDLLADNTDPIPLTFNFNDGDIAPRGAPDGILNAADQSVAAQIMVGKISATNNDLAHGDLYPVGAPDGIINVSDHLLLIQNIHPQQ